MGVRGVGGVRIGALLVLAAGLAHSLAYRAYQPDDAFIFLTYARNLLAGHGLTFNGDIVEGYSSLLWCLAVAGLGSTGLDLLQVAKLLGNLLYLVVLPLVMFDVVRRMSADWRPWHLLALGAIFFSLPPLALWSAGALETMLEAALLTFACWRYFVASVVEPSRRNAVFAGLGFGLLTLARPEGFAFMGLVPVFEASKAVLRRGVAWRTASVCVGVGVAMFAGLLAWRHGFYGAWLPVTVSAKTGDFAAQFMRGQAYVLLFVHDQAGFLVALAASCAVVLARGGRQSLFALMVIIVVAGQTAFTLLAGGDWMPGSRFLVPVLPLASCVIVLALQPWPRLMAAVAIVLALLGVRASLPLHAMAMEQTQAAHGDIVMGKYIADLKLPPDAVVAVVDAGAIPYFTGLPAVDMVGLNNAHIAALPGGFLRKWDNRYVLSRRPEIIQMHTFLHEAGASPLDDFQGNLELYYSDEFQRWYDWDARSPVPNLYRRRHVPRDGSFMASFSRLQLDVRYDAARQQVVAEVLKQGTGAWPVQQGRMQNGTTYLRARWLSDTDAVLAEHYQPMPRVLREGERASLQWSMPLQPGRRLQVCAVLLSIADFPGCVVVPAG